MRSSGFTVSRVFICGRRLKRYERSVLAPGGLLILEQPDISICVRAIANSGPLFWLFGDPALQEPLHMNRWGYTPDSLTDLLRSAGFAKAITLKKAEYHDPARDFRIEAVA